MRKTSLGIGVATLGLTAAPGYAADHQGNQANEYNDGNGDIGRITP